MKYAWMVVLALFLISCSDQKPYDATRPAIGQQDWCGFTWKKDPQGYVTTIHIKVVPDWQQRPGICKSPYNVACANRVYNERTFMVEGELIVGSWDDVSPLEKNRQCDPVMHELIHLLGYTHDQEERIYNPSDYARR